MAPIKIFPALVMQVQIQQRYDRNSTDLFPDKVKYPFVYLLDFPRVVLSGQYDHTDVGRGL